MYTENIIYKNTGNNDLTTLFKGYLYGLGEVCHGTFGKEGEEAIYKAIGNFFLNYLKKKGILDIGSYTDPWERYCILVKMFTDYGFYSYAELKVLSENSYWMAESGQYAGDIWEESGSWERGTPPCPLWSTILVSLSEIGYSITIDDLKYSDELQGYESTFHFFSIPIETTPVLTATKIALQKALLPICCCCKKIRDNDNKWIPVADYISRNHPIDFTHGICPECARSKYEGILSEEELNSIK
jgi:hypothetical protein